MKISITLLLLFINLWATSQDCENTIFSNNPLITINPSTYVINCKTIETDTIFEFNPVKDSKFHSCFKLYHNEQKWLIEEKWTSNDTIYSKKYYPSGKLKNASYFYDYLTLSSIHFYENGQVEYGGIERIDTLQKKQSFYKDGSLRHESFVFAGSPYNTKITYFKNGAISSKTEYTPFSPKFLNNLNYRSTEILKECFFDYDGDTLSFMLEEPINVNVFQYPIIDTSRYPIDTDTYSFYHVNNQKGYDNSMSLLKTEIIKRIKIPKSYNCPIAYCYIILTINKDGTIKFDDCSFERKELYDAVKNAINEIGVWEIGLLNEKPVNIEVYTDLLIE